MSLILSGSSGLSDVDGSASTPSLRGTDADSGVFFPAADTVAIATGGTERVRTDSSGNVGIGTSSPATQLHLSSATPPVIRLQTATTSSAYGVNWYYTDSASVKCALTLNLGAAEMRMSAGESGNTYFQSFYTNGSERARIDSSGNLLVGGTSIASVGKAVYIRRDGATSAYIQIGGTASSSDCLYFYNSNGLVGSVSTSGSTTTYATSSDYRLKEDVVPMSGALARVAALKPVTYKWKVDGSDGEGFIAHELQAVCPNAVVGEKDAVDAEGSPKYQGIDTSFLVATLTAAIQELKGIVDSQAARIAALEGAAQ